MLRLFQERGLEVGPLEIAITSSVPPGGGLSSSAALEVAMATLLEAVTGHTLDPVEKAYLCQKAEHDYAAVPCGIMDQFTSVMAKADHLLLLDCRSAEVTHVPFLDTEISVLIINSNVRHALTGGEYAERRQQCFDAAKVLGVSSLRDITLKEFERQESQLSDVHRRRARHVISENQRVLDFVNALENRDWSRVGELMLASHASLHDDYEVSCPELDLLVELATEHRDSGLIGSRMTGGGFGGCTVSLVETVHRVSISDAITSKYEHETGIKPTCFTSRPAAGACILS